METLIISYILTTCACLGITYYVFSRCAMEGEGGEILLLIIISFTPVVNYFALLMVVLSTLEDPLIRQLNKQLKKRKK